MRIFITSLLLVLCTLFSNAQSSRANWWYFGTNAGMHFSSGSPTAVSNGQLNTLEGCASISDSKGSLLFYTDGRTVYNKNHVAMTNGTGLMGHSSSTTSAIIVPKPGSSTRYYIFTTPSTNNTAGLRWSEVDMTASLGLGSVISTSKNTLIKTPVSENLAVINHANGKDVWIVAVGTNTNTYYAYLLTSAGISSTSTNTTLGPITSVWGYLKASPSGKKIAIANGGTTVNSNVVIFDFNNKTGALSNNIQITSSSGRPYGLEFSPNEKFLYYTNWYFPSSLHQVNLLAGTSTQIIASDSVISYGATRANYGALQLAPNGKIYMANAQDTFLGVINNPNRQWSACNFVLNGFKLSQGKRSQLGLPSFNQSFFSQTLLSITNPCAGAWVKISVLDTGAVDSVYYTYGDTASSSNSSWNKLDSHQYSSPGKYLIVAHTFSRGPTGGVIKDTLRDSIDVLAIPRIRLPNDTILCKGDSIEGLVLNSNYTGKVQFYWQDSSAANWHKIDSSGRYILKAFNQCGVGSDTVNILNILKRSFDIGNDTLICSGDTLRLIGDDTSATYKWSNGSTNRILNHVGTKTETIWGEKLNKCGTYKDSVLVSVLNKPFIDLGPDTSICQGKFAVLGDSRFSPYSTYKWSNGSTSFTIFTYNAGLITVTEKNQCDSIVDSVYVTVDVPVSVQLPADTVICRGDTVLLKPTSALTNYKWSNGSTDSVLLVSKAGYYTLNSTNACGSSSDGFLLMDDTALVVQLPPDTSLCDGDVLEIKPLYGLPSYNWSTGSKNPSIMVNKSATYSLSAKNACGSQSDSIQVSFLTPIKPVISRNDDTLISSIARSYQWYLNGVLLNGDTNRHLPINVKGKYKVFTTDTNGCGTNSADEEIEFLYNVGIKAEFEQLGIKLFPNPVTDYLLVEFASETNKNIELELLDAKGALVMRIQFQIEQGLHTERMDLNGIASGSYQIKIIQGESQQYFKLIKLD